MTMANKKIMTAYEAAKDLKQQLKTIELLLSPQLDTIREYMGESVILFAPHGGEIVTYKQSKSRIVLNADLLKEKHPRIYTACCIEREGSRVLLLK